MPSRVKEAWGEGPSRPPQAAQAIADEEAEDDDNVTKDEWFEQVSALKQKQVNKQQKRGPSLRTTRPRASSVPKPRPLTASVSFSTSRRFMWRGTCALDWTL